MKLDSIKKINLTFLFSEPINHNDIHPDDILEVIELEEEEKSTVQGPHFIGIFLEKGISIIFEQQRFLITDKRGMEPDDSEIVNYAIKILEDQLPEELKISAHGFNYDLVANCKDLTIDDLLGEGVTTLPFQLKSGGININFDHKNLKYSVQTKLMSKGDDKIGVHFNVHNPQEGVPSLRETKNLFRNQLEFLKREVLSNLE